ncbi:MAG: hypothetical protein QCI38_01170 [Candidatus Thermoplasmatota archaeon]|nr:hypothetical protein [Candidatus Thermoplasmatota archaeon]
MLGEASGTAELSELLVATLLVVVSMSLFTASIAGSLQNSIDVDEDALMQTKVQSMAASLRSSPILCREPGFYSLEKLASLESSSAQWEMHPDICLSTTRIVVEDRGRRNDANIFVFGGESPVDANLWTASLPIILEVDQWERRPGMLIVQVWRG